MADTEKISIGRTLPLPPCFPGRDLAEEHARLRGVLLGVQRRHPHGLVLAEDAAALVGGVVAAALPALVRLQLEVAVAVGEREEAERDCGEFGQVARAGLLVAAQLFGDGQGA